MKLSAISVLFVLALCFHLLLADNTSDYRDNRRIGTGSRPAQGGSQGGSQGAQTLKPLRVGYKGARRKTASGKFYYAFEGIRFGDPPTGPYRFQAPRKATLRSGVYDATSPGSPCVQTFRSQVAGEEDCLFLNVYTPKLLGQITSPLPVLVNIHGGSFLVGAGSIFRPDYFMERGEVILVTPNYRLGVYGFLSTGDEHLPGNRGLQDQLLALEWVHDNILSFGGNPADVTVMGNSAGAVSAALLTFRREADNLFHKVILESGSPLLEVLFTRDPLPSTTLLAEEVGCPTNTTREMADCFMKLTPQEMEEGRFNVSAGQLGSGLFDFVTSPLIGLPDGRPLPTMTFDDPQEMLDLGNFKPRPMIIGVNKEDSLPYSLLLFEARALDALLSSPEEIVKREIEDYMYILGYTNNLNVTVEEVFHEYFDDVDLFDPGSAFRAFTVLETDLAFNLPAYRTAQYWHKYAPTYLYRFDYRGNNSAAEVFFDFSELFEGSLFGKEEFYLPDDVVHSDEVLYLFPVELPELGDHPKEYVAVSQPDDVTVKNNMIELWSNFAKYGDPTPEHRVSNLPKWRPVTWHSFNYYKIDKSATLELDFNTRRMDFWNVHIATLDRQGQATEEDERPGALEAQESRSRPQVWGPAAMWGVGGASSVLVLVGASRIYSFYS